MSRTDPKELMNERDLDAVDQALAGLRPVDPPAHVVARTLSAVAARRRQRARKGIGVALLGTAAACAAMAMFIVLGRPTSGPQTAVNRSDVLDVQKSTPTNSAVRSRYWLADRTTGKERTGGQTATAANMASSVPDDSWVGLAENGQDEGEASSRERASEGDAPNQDGRDLGMRAGGSKNDETAGDFVDGAFDVKGGEQSEDDKRQVIAGKDGELAINGRFYWHDGKRAAPGPVVDRDADGIADERDRCPTEPEDVDGFVDDDGCPDLDIDQDRIVLGDDGQRERGMTSLIPPTDLPAGTHTVDLTVSKDGYKDITGLTGGRDEGRGPIKVRAKTRNPFAATTITEVAGDQQGEGEMGRSSVSEIRNLETLRVSDLEGLGTEEKGKAAEDALKQVFRSSLANAPSSGEEAPPIGEEPPEEVDEDLTDDLGKREIVGLVSKPPGARIVVSPPSDVDDLFGYFQRFDDGGAAPSVVEATGYWKNTYIPGDPAVAALRAALGQRLMRDGAALALEESAAPVVQPFDAPVGTGLAVFASADRAAVTGPTRVTLQVGLKGAEQAATRRASLDVALVVDVRELTSEPDRQALWSLADALATDRQAGDRFSLVVAGGAAPVIVAPEGFDGATVRGALAQALTTSSEGPRADFASSVHRAYRDVRARSESSAPLGGRLVVIATANDLSASEVEALAASAHAEAVAGTHTSIVGVGGHVEAADLSAIAAAGQGRQRHVTTPSAARGAADTELSAAGRAVARAVRLRIRLADGVRLHGILGSERLDTARAERVRRAEKAIDRKVADTMGIRADRGEDEAGIQIVIPAFYAGDAHVILLDIEVPGPGAVADVQVRYKDLVRMTNTVATAGLTLSEGADRVSPLTRNVVKNRVAHRLVTALGEASTAVRRGDQGVARATLAEAAGLVAQAQQLPGLATDAELRRDAELLAAYDELLGEATAWAAQPEMITYVARSLTLAGHVKAGRAAPR